MVIVEVHWLMRSKGLIGSFLVHKIHFSLESEETDVLAVIW
jgi:hypothetical protein